MASMHIKALSIACVCSPGGGVGKKEAEGSQELSEPHQ